MFWIILNDATVITGVLEEGGHINYSMGAKIGLIFSITLRYTTSLTPNTNSGRRKTFQKRPVKSQQINIALQEF